jgi:ABC-type Mn2+/Zn2+ transport system permease subunit
MVSSLQAVGVLLSLGLLVLPAATIYLLSDSYAAMSWGGGVVGALSAIAGLQLSFWTNIPSGPAIILVLGTLFVGAYLFGPKYGITSKWLRQRHMHEESLQRWQ